MSLKELAVKAILKPLAYMAGWFFAEFHTSSRNGLTIIVFSKDRAAQLELFLRSAARHIRGEHEINVIYKASTKQEKVNYSTVIGEFERCRWIHQSEKASLRRLVLKCLWASRYSTGAFMVDDMVCIGEVIAEKISHYVIKGDCTFSLRLGKNITRSFMLSRLQEQPFFSSISGNRLEWRIEDELTATNDWQYLFSVDGDIASIKDLWTVSLITPFKTPNELESRGQRVKGYMSRRRACFVDSVVCNIPNNLVQAEFGNQNLGGCASVLSDVFKEGHRISLADLERHLPGDSVHMELAYTFQWPDKK